MILSAYISLTKPHVVTTLASLSTASSSSNNNNSSTNPITPDKPPRVAPLKRKSPKRNQLSVGEVERAIGAGIYRDYDPASETTEKEDAMDIILSNTIGKTEGPTERKLRETGEWINAKTEKSSRSLSKKVLKIMFFWIVPTWFIMLLFATGAVKLPSTFTALNDFIM